MWSIRKVATFAIVVTTMLLILAVPVQAPASFGVDTGETRDADDPDPTDPVLAMEPPAPLDPAKTEALLYIEDRCGNEHRITWRFLGTPSVCAADGDGSAAGGPLATDEPVLTLPAAPEPIAATHSHGVRPDAPGTQTTKVASRAPTTDTAEWPTGYRWVALAAAVAAAVLVPVLLRVRTRQDNEIRSRIFDRIVDDPGVSASSLAEDLDIHLTTAIYHLDVLQDQDRIEGLDQGRSTMYFENHHRYGRLEKRLLTALRKDTPNRLLELVVQNPGIHCAELARRLDLSRTSVKYHTDRLIDDGLLDQERSGGTMQLQVPDRARELFERYTTPV